MGCLDSCLRQAGQYAAMQWLARLRPLEPRTICKSRKPDGCNQPLMEDGYCHNPKCNVEKRLNSLFKTDGKTPLQRQINYAMFRRFLAD